MSKLAQASGDSKLESSVAAVSHAVGSIITFASQHPAQLELAARDFAFSLARTYMGEHALK